jgi:hypothetical protein
VKQIILPELDGGGTYRDRLLSCVFLFHLRQKELNSTILHRFDFFLRIRVLLGYRPWFYNQTKAPMEVLETKSILFGPNLVAQDVGVQLGGEVVNYAEGLAFATFHGSGHMV